MGNPSIHPAATNPEIPDMLGVNGVLTRVTGDLIGAAKMSLPKAEASEPPERQVTVEVPALGAVVITFRLNMHRHGRGKFWSWLATRANLEDEKPRPKPRAKAGQGGSEKRPRLQYGAGTAVAHSAVGGASSAGTG